MNISEDEFLGNTTGQGEVAEHPAWEDLIMLENLAARREELDAHLVQLHDAANHRAF
jgi:hypothetical protein